jgi:hypothetical protein
MQSHKLVVKLFAQGADNLAADAVVPVFHAWIRDQALADHLLIDVADYAHVPDGPGTVLVAHEANIHFDYEGGKPGLLYIRKQPVAGAETFRERVAAVFRAALEAAAKLEKEPALHGIHFRADEVIFRINDRLLGPNDQETFAAVKGDLQSLFGSDASLQYVPDAQRLFEVRIKPGRIASVTDLLNRLEPAPTPAR